MASAARMPTYFMGQSLAARAMAPALGPIPSLAQTVGAAHVLKSELSGVLSRGASVWASTYDLESGKPLTRIALYDTQPIKWLSAHLTADLDPSGSILATVDPAGLRRIDIWAMDGKKVQSWIPYIEERGLDIQKRGPIAHLFAINSRQILTLSAEGETVLWDVATRLPIYRGATFHGLAVSPRREFFAAVRDEGIDLFRTATGEFHGRLPLPASTIPPAKLLGFSADGTHLLALAAPKRDDKKVDPKKEDLRAVRLVAWDLTTGKVRADFEVAPDHPEFILMPDKICWSNRDFLLDEMGHLFDLKTRTLLWVYKFPLQWGGGAAMNGVFPDERCWGIKDGQLRPIVLPHPAARDLSQKVQALAGKEIGLRKQPVRVAVRFQGLKEKQPRHEQDVRNRLQAALSLSRIRVADDGAYTVTLDASMAGGMAMGKVVISNANGVTVWQQPLSAQVGRPDAPFEWLGEKTLDVRWPTHIVESAQAAIALPGRSALTP
jgi:hypothetical protein